MDLNNFANLVAASASNWSGWSVLRVILLIAIAVLSLVLICTILFQPGNDGSGMNAMTGASSDTYYGKNRSQTLESALKRLTVILAIVIAVLAVFFFVTLFFSAY